MGIILFPIGIPLYIIGIKGQASLLRDIKTVLKINNDVMDLINRNEI